jgi:hypothetical protein
MSSYMNYHFRSQLFAGLLLLVLSSCTKQEAKEYFLGGTAPALTASVSGTIPLSFTTENEQAVKFSWTNPDYSFASGVNTLDVAYTLEIDEAGKEFKGANKKAISISKDLNIVYTQKQFNIILSDLQLKTNVAASIDVRIVASLGSEATKLYSNALRFNVTPFAPPPKVPVPTAGTLWIIGDAVGSGWNNPLPSPYVTSQKFTKVTETLYELVLTMGGGGAYKLIQENGVWGTQYHRVDGNAYAGTFEKKDADPAFLGPDEAGTYKIVVDFQTGKFTVTKQ